MHCGKRTSASALESCTPKTLQALQLDLAQSSAAAGVDDAQREAQLLVSLSQNWDLRTRKLDSCLVLCRRSSILND